MLTKIVNSKRGKFTALLLACVVLFSSFTAPTGNSVVLKSGTMVSLELINEVTSNMKAGQTIDFRVMNDVKADGVVVIPAGSIAKGQIVSASKHQLLGIQGEVTVQVKSVNAIDGTRVALSGSSLTVEGDNKIVSSIVLTVLCFFGFLLKGGNGVILPGTTFDAPVAYNTDIAI